MVVPGDNFKGDIILKHVYNMRIFLDDIRQPSDCLSYMQYRMNDENLDVYRKDWVVVKDYNEFVSTIQKNYKLITHVSFDHDLSDEHYSPLMYSSNPSDYNELYADFDTKTGYDCAKWMRNFYSKKKVELPEIYIHTMNPIGYSNIYQTFN